VAGASASSSSCADTFTDDISPIIRKRRNVLIPVFIVVVFID
jgi:hypothetical protein